MLGASSGDGLLDLGPLNDEVSQCLGLNGRPASKFYRVSAKLDCPLDDAVIGLFVMVSPRGNSVTTMIL